MNYTELLIEADNHSLITKDKPLLAHDGRIKGNRIAIRKNMTETKKKCVLAEELGHYHTSSGDILDQTVIENRRQEYRARLWGYDKLIGLSGIISCYRSGCKTLSDMADHLDVTEDFLKEALRAATMEYPNRGPEFYQSGEYIYKSKVTGDFTWFQGYEEIYCKDIKVYECYFHGGLMK